MFQKIITLLSTLLLCTAISASDTSILNGKSSLQDAQYDTLIVNGSFHAKNLTITNLLTINGSFNGEKIHCRHLSVNGSTDVSHLHAQSVQSNGSFYGQDITVTKDAQFSGQLRIKKGSFNEIHASSQNICLKETVVAKNILIKNPQSSWLFWQQKDSSKPAVIEIGSGCVVQGDVVFEGPYEGTVLLSSTARIEGRVLNGNISTTTAKEPEMAKQPLSPAHAQ